MKSFYQQFKRLVTGKEDLSGRKELVLENAFVYLWKLLVCLMVFFGVQYFVYFSITIPPVAKSALQTFHDHPGLAISLTTEGVLEVNAETPLYVVPTPSLLRLPSDPDNLLTVDVADANYADIVAHNSQFVFAKDGFWMQEKQRRMDFTPYVTSEQAHPFTFTVDEQKVQDIVNSVWWDLVPLGFAIFVVLDIIGHGFGLLLLNLLGAFVIQKYLKLKGVSLDYFPAYTRGLYLMTWPVLVYAGLFQFTTLGPHLTWEMWIGISAAYLIAIAANLHQTTKRVSGK